MSMWPSNTFARTVESPVFGKVLEVNLGHPTEKTCSFDCPFCYLGRSERTLSELRKPGWFASIEQVQLEIDKLWRHGGGSHQAILISGNGEPTLHPNFYEFMKGLPSHYNVPSIVMTNGAHVSNKKVLAGLKLASEVIIRVDAGSDAGVAMINQPLTRFKLKDIFQHAARLSNLSVQTMAVKGLIQNLSAENLAEWMESVRLLKPQKVYLQTPLREQNSFVPLDETEMAMLVRHIEKSFGIRCITKELLILPQAAA